MAMIGKSGLIAFAAALAFAGPVHARDPQSSAQSRATQRQQMGENLPARELERRMLMQHRGEQYLGFEYDPDSNIYTFKFVRKGCVIKVYVNGRGQGVGGEGC